jgi:hypothetical protein
MPPSCPTSAVVLWLKCNLMLFSGPPDVPFLVAVDVTGTNSVTVRFQEPEQQDSAICTKFKGDRLQCFCIQNKLMWYSSVHMHWHLWDYVIYLSMLLAKCWVFQYYCHYPRVKIWVTAHLKSPIPNWQALAPTQPSIQWVLGALSPGLKRPGLEAHHSPPTSAKVKKCGSIHPLTHMPSWRSA